MNTLLRNELNDFFDYVSEFNIDRAYYGTLSIELEAKWKKIFEDFLVRVCEAFPKNIPDFRFIEEKASSRRIVINQVKKLSLQNQIKLSSEQLCELLLEMIKRIRKSA